MGLYDTYTGAYIFVGYRDGAAKKNNVENDGML